MNKDEMSLKATYGVMKPASQTGLKLPSMANLLPEKYAGEDTVLPFDLAKANQLLDAAGYKKGADGKRTNPDGSPLAVTSRCRPASSTTRRSPTWSSRDSTTRRPRQGHGVRPDSVDGQKKSGTTS